MEVTKTITSTLFYNSNDRDKLIRKQIMGHFVLSRREYLKFEGEMYEHEQCEHDRKSRIT